MALGTLVHRHPARGFFARSRDFDRLVEDLWSGFALRPVQTRPSGSSSDGKDERVYRPRLDASESESEYRVRVEIPGVEPGEVEVTVHDGVLTLEGERVFGEDAKASFEERIRFPGEIVQEDVKAVHKNGVLTVTVPKRTPEKPEVKAIPVQAS